VTDRLHRKVKRFSRNRRCGNILRRALLLMPSAGSLGFTLKNRMPASTHKKVVVLLLDHTAVKGYVNPKLLGQSEAVDVLTQDGEHRPVATEEVKAVYFVREFDADFEPERKTFLSRPKLDGLWVRLRFTDEDVIEGIVSNDLLDLLNSGVQLTPPDLHGNTLRMFVPRSALAEMKVLGVVGISRRPARQPVDAPTRAPLPAQTKLFGE
jgi:hypothetical protein